MVEITAADELRARLGEADTVVELRDPSGRTLGHFVPNASRGRSPDGDGRPYSPEESARMRAEAGGRPRPDPLSFGEGRSGPVRIAIVPPSAVYSDVSEGDRLVAVWAVWRSEPG